MQKLIIKISCLLMCLILVACASNNNSPVELRVQDGYIQYDNGSGWTNLISTEELKGEQGEQGIQGEKGETGDKGEKGDKGDKGDPGTNGTNGTNGKDGTNGVDGKDGVNGKDGANGVNGKDGKDGIDGKDGVDGKDAIVQDNITKSFSINTAFSSDYPDQTKNYGYLVISSQDKAVISRTTSRYDDDTKVQSISILMNENGKVTVEAKPEENWKFVKWSDGSTVAKRTVSYTDLTYLVAFFEYTKTPLDKIESLTEEVDYGTKNLTLTWKKIENAKDYTIYLNRNDDELSFTSSSNSLTIEANKLKQDTWYELTIVANPSNTSKNMSTSYSNGFYYYDDSNLMITVPSFTQGVTTYNDYYNKLRAAGSMIGAAGPVFEGATKENNGTVATVNPAPGSKVKQSTVITVGIYEYTEQPTPEPTESPDPTGSPDLSATIPGNLLGTSESNFLAKLKSLGFNNVVKSNITYYSTTLASGTIYSYDDGTFTTDTTINYALSAGPYIFNANDFNGLTAEEVTSKVKDLQNRNAAKGNLSVSFKPGEKDSSQAGKVHDCSFNSDTISCYVYQSSDSDKTVTTASILSIADIRSNYTGENFDIIQNKVREYLNGQGFYNLTFNSVAADGYYVSEIYVGNQKHTSAASYDTSSNITVYIAYPNN